MPPTKKIKKIKKILGLGSWLGADNIGWKVVNAIEELAELNNNLWQCTILDKPGLSLLHNLNPDTPTIIIDALIAPAPVGALFILNPDDLKMLMSPYSSHGFKLAETIEFAKILNTLPQELIIIGIVIQSTTDSASPNIDSYATLSPEKLDPVWIAKWIIKNISNLLQNLS